MVAFKDIQNGVHKDVLNTKKFVLSFNRNRCYRKTSQNESQEAENLFKTRGLRSVNIRQGFPRTRPSLINISVSFSRYEQVFLNRCCWCLDLTFLVECVIRVVPILENTPGCMFALICFCMRDCSYSRGQKLFKRWWAAYS